MIAQEGERWNSPQSVSQGSYRPTYSQRMAVAAMEALDLQRELRMGTEGLRRRVFPQAARSIDSP